MKKKVLIMGAAGRDFHNFNVFFRDNPDYEVVAFTATQIPNIEGRIYPKELCGKLYPKGIQIYPESELSSLIKRLKVDEVVFSYSDVSHDYVMQKGALVNAAGASFMLLSPMVTQVKSIKPVISVTAVRTGCGKSQTTRKICDLLIKSGKRAVAIRHPMPYGDLVKQEVQRFATIEDLKKHECTIEEMEEYEPYIARGMIVYAGVDYEKILRAAEKEADIILWDGGNNDSSFIKSDLSIVVVDPHRAGHELRYYPGHENFITADVIIINKEDTAKKEDIAKIKENIAIFNPKARVIDAGSPISVDKPEEIKGKSVLVVEDGPTVTHGGMGFGAGLVAAEKYGAKQIVDPRPFLVGSLEGTFKKYNHLRNVLPAMGYGEAQIKDLQETIMKVKCDTVIIGTPIDLRRIVKITKPTVRVEYNLEEQGELKLKDVIGGFTGKQKGKK